MQKSLTDIMIDAGFNLGLRGERISQLSQLVYTSMEQSNEKHIQMINDCLLFAKSPEETSYVFFLVGIIVGKDWTTETYEEIIKGKL